MDIGIAILVTGALLAAACALPGVFLLLRGATLLVEAISHAVLPGIVLAYILTSGSSAIAGLFGALMSALLAVMLITLLRRYGRIASDSATGLVFSTLFALGVLIVARYGAGVRMNPDAMLLGSIEYVVFEPLMLFGAQLGSAALWTAAGLLALNLAFVLLTYRHLALSTFDPGFAETLGFSPALIQFVLMALTAVTTVGAFQLVGIVLVLAFVVVPAATASMLTDDLKRMMGLAVGAGVLAAVLGYGFARLLDVSVSGSIVMMLGAQFALAVLFAPPDAHRALGRGE